jgi:hypothetical protein
MVQHLVKRDVNGPTDRHDPLRRQCVTHGSKDLVAHLNQGQASRLGRFEDGGMPGARLRLEVQVPDCVRPVRDNLANSLWALREEKMLTFTNRAPAQSPH